MFLHVFVCVKAVFFVLSKILIVCLNCCVYYTEQWEQAVVFRERWVKKQDGIQQIMFYVKLCCRSQSNSWGVGWGLIWTFGN